MGPSSFLPPAFSEQRISIIALGVKNLGDSRAFYVNTLGWKPHEELERIIFFDMGGLVFSIAERQLLAEDSGIAENTPPDGDTASRTPGKPQPGNPVFSLAYNARTQEEVDEIFTRLKAHETRIVKPPQKVFWGGYSGYFSDPDGYLWEVAFNPFWKIDEDGRLNLSNDTSK